jgi:hypothetical protein
LSRGEVDKGRKDLGLIELSRQYYEDIIGRANGAKFSRIKVGEVGIVVSNRGGR